MNIQSGLTLRPSLFVRIVSAAFGTALALVISSFALAADKAPEVKTAAVHAGLAASVGDIKGVRAHLHHTLNCLVGPDGEGFNANEINPCQGMGKGAIPDTADAARKQALKEAVDMVQSGLDSDDLATAQKAAADTKEMLEAHEM
tara:strand:+ start:109 stop:543 length:435 start_codon:yes stop_codon:yes gene_type:complete